MKLNDKIESGTYPNAGYFDTFVSSRNKLAIDKYKAKIRQNQLLQSFFLNTTNFCRKMITFAYNLKTARSSK
jgi:hypothetical protein